MPISNFPRLKFTDIYETEVLDRTAGFYVATDPVDAEDEPTTLTSMVSMHGVNSWTSSLISATTPVQVARSCS